MGSQKCTLSLHALTLVQIANTPGSIDGNALPPFSFLFFPPLQGVTMRSNQSPGETATACKVVQHLRQVITVQLPLTTMVIRINYSAKEEGKKGTMQNKIWAAGCILTKRNYPTRRVSVAEGPVQQRQAGKCITFCCRCMKNVCRVVITSSVLHPASTADCFTRLPAEEPGKYHHVGIPVDPV